MRHLASILISIVLWAQAPASALQTGDATATASAQALLVRATEALDSGEIETATTLYEELRDMHPENAAGWYGGGLAAEAAGDLAGAVELLGRAAAIDPDNPLAHLTHGRVLARLGSTLPALAALERARALEPSHPNGYLFAALLLRSEDKNAEAEQLLRAGIESARPASELWDQLGLALLSQRKPQEALTIAVEGLALFPASVRLELVRGLALAQNPESRLEAIASLEKAIGGGQGGASARLELADLLLDEDRLDDAITRLQEAVAIAPGNTQTHYRLGLALQQAGRREEAALSLQQFRELSSQQKTVDARAKRLGQQLNAAIEHLQADRLDEALAAVQEVLAEAPGHARTLAIKAKILFSKGDLAGALDAAAEARAADPTMTEHHYLVGLFSYHLGRFAEADAALGSALAMDPELGEAHEIAAVMAYRSGRPAAAVAHFERAIELGVDHEELRKAYRLAMEAAAAPQD